MPIALFQDLGGRPELLVGLAWHAERGAQVVHDVLVRRRHGSAGGFLADEVGALPVGVRIAAGERRTAGCVLASLGGRRPLAIAPRRDGLPWRRPLEALA